MNIENKFRSLKSSKRGNQRKKEKKKKEIESSFLRIPKGLKD